MAAVKANEVERVLRRLPPGINVLLFYGPDAGRVSERARHVAEAGVSDPADPFQLVKLDGDDVAERPGRLSEEVATYGLFGERRVIWVRPTGRNIAAPVAACLSKPLKDALVVVEAGDLARNSPLRVACEQSRLALALPCYEDQARDVGGAIDEMLASEGLRMEADARELLIESLGGDRLATRSELAKLALFCRGGVTVTVQDVEAVVSDVSSLSIDVLLDAAFSGDVGGLDAAWVQHAVHGTNVGAILSGASRHVLSLLACRMRVELGDDLETALSSWRGLHFRRRTSVQRQLERWRVRSLEDVSRTLFEATARTRQVGMLAPAIAAATLLRVAGYGTGRGKDPRSERQSPSS